MSVRSASNSQNVEIFVLKEVRPCLDLRIDLGKVLDRKALAADPLLHGERLAHHLLLRSDEPDPKDRKIAWLRVFPQYDHDRYDLEDPLATDLEEYGYVFAKVYRLDGHVGYLDEVAAPSFHGYKAVDVIRNLMALAHIEHLFLRDGSKTLPCCKSGAVTPFRPLSAFMNGKSWYEMQGATIISRAPAAAHRTFSFEDELVFSDPDCYEFLKNPGPVRAHPMDFDRIVFEWSKSYENPPIEAAAYTKAKDLLHSVSAKELGESLRRLGDRDPSLQQLWKTLQQASSMYPSCTLVGGLLKALKPTKEDSFEHRLLHELRDGLIPKYKTSFSECIADRLSKAVTTSEFSYALALSVLRIFMSKLRKREVIDGLLKADRQQLDIMTAKYQDVFVQYSWTEEEGKITWKTEKDEELKNPFLSAHQALQHIVQIPISMLRTIYPDLAETLIKRCHLSEASIVAGCTIEDIIASSEPSEKEWILDKLIWEATLEDLSALFVRYMNKRELGERTEELCLLVMLAEYICEQTEMFVLSLP